MVILFISCIVSLHFIVIILHNICFLFADSVIGSRSFATCAVRVLSGLPVVIKQVYRETVKQQHILQEAHLLQVSKLQLI